MMVLIVLSVGLGGFRVTYCFLMMHRFDRMPEPFGMCIRPFRMVRVHPTGIVIMPPAFVAPHMTRVVGAYSVLFEPLVFVGMVLHEGFQFRMIVPELAVVKQRRIGAHLST